MDIWRGIWFGFYLGVGFGIVYGLRERDKDLGRGTVGWHSWKGLWKWTG